MIKWRNVDVRLALIFEHKQKKTSNTYRRWVHEFACFSGFDPHLIEQHHFCDFMLYLSYSGRSTQKTAMVALAHLDKEILKTKSRITVDAEFNETHGRKKHDVAKRRAQKSGSKKQKRRAY